MGKGSLSFSVDVANSIIMLVLAGAFISTCDQYFVLDVLQLTWILLRLAPAPSFFESFWNHCLGLISCIVFNLLIIVIH